MAGGGARRGTLVIHYGTGHRRPAPRPRQPRDGTGSCGSQPAHQSLLDRRLQRRPRPCATFDRLLATELIGRRTLMPYALETGHESGETTTDGTLASLWMSHDRQQEHPAGGYLLSASDHYLP